MLLDQMVRGFLKEAATAVLGMWGVTGKIDKWLFVNPRIIPLTRDGARLLEPDGKEDRPLRADVQGIKIVAISSSEKVNEGTQFEYDLVVFPLGQTKGGLTEDAICTMLDYGKYQGMGQFRNGSFGRFTYTITEKATA